MPFPNPETQFKPGNSGRPLGTRSVTSRLRDLLEKGEINGKPIKDGKQVADLLASVIMASALKGDYRFVSLILDRTEGKMSDDTEEPTPEKASDAYADLLAKLYPDQPG